MSDVWANLSDFTIVLGLWLALSFVSILAWRNFFGLIVYLSGFYMKWIGFFLGQEVLSSIIIGSFKLNFQIFLFLLTFLRLQTFNAGQGRLCDRLRTLGRFKLSLYFKSRLSLYFKSRLSLGFYSGARVLFFFRIWDLKIKIRWHEC